MGALLTTRFHPSSFVISLPPIVHPDGSSPGSRLAPLPSDSRRGFGYPFTLPEDVFSSQPPPPSSSGKR